MKEERIKEIVEQVLRGEPPLMTEEETEHITWRYIYTSPFSGRTVHFDIK